MDNGQHDAIGVICILLLLAVAAFPAHKGLNIDPLNYPDRGTLPAIVTADSIKIVDIDIDPISDVRRIKMQYMKQEVLEAMDSLTWEMTYGR